MSNCLNVSVHTKTPNKKKISFSKTGLYLQAITSRCYTKYANEPSLMTVTSRKKREAEGKRLSCPGTTTPYTGKSPIVE